MVINDLNFIITIHKIVIPEADVMMWNRVKCVSNPALPVHPCHQMFLYNC